MDAADNTNLDAPYLGPQDPLYPQVCQVVRAVSPYANTSNFFGFVQQLIPGSILQLRDREPCFVWEPNGFPLVGYHDCRLVGQFNGLPLYITNCCPTQVIPQPSSSSPFSGPIRRTALGAVQEAGGLLPTLTVAVDPGALLIVTASITGSGGQIGATFAGGEMDPDLSVSLPVGGALAGTLACFSLSSPSGQTGVIELEVTGGVFPTGATIQAVEVQGLAAGIADQGAVATGFASSPASGATPTTSTAAEYVQGAVLMLTPGGAWTWTNSFSSGGQDLSQVEGGVTTAATEGYRILSSTGAPNAGLSGVSPAAWAALAATYR